MHLMNIATNQLQLGFSSSNPPPYAILSHRWSESEISFQDIKNAQTSQDHLQLNEKIRGACLQARSDAFQYVWIDSCCIDRTNEAQLSESINSMFEWYEQAAVCYVYLQDVTCSKAGKLDTLRQFQESVWFHRGWTLQELLAPTKLEFYDSQWQFIGTKATLETEIERATGIEAQYLDNFRSASIAQRMSWASTRETTVREDAAYCMLGIFSVNMDLRYGEGERAFRRLQEELIKVTDDESIFAWRSDKEKTYGLLAPNLHCFKDSKEIICNSPKRKPRTPPYRMTNRGLEFSISRSSGIFCRNHDRNRVEVELNCWQQGRKTEDTATIILEKIEGDVWQRVDCENLRFRHSVKSRERSMLLPSTEALYIPQVRHSQYEPNRN